MPGIRSFPDDSTWRRGPHTSLRPFIIHGYYSNFLTCSAMGTQGKLQHANDLNRRKRNLVAPRACDSRRAVIDNSLFPVLWNVTGCNILHFISLSLLKCVFVLQSSGLFFSDRDWTRAASRCADYSTISGVRFPNTNAVGWPMTWSRSGCDGHDVQLLCYLGLLIAAFTAIAAQVIAFTMST